MDAPPLRKVDAVMVPVPDLDSGIDFYVGRLGHPLLWRNDEIGQAAVALTDGDTEIVLTTTLRYEPNWLVEDVEEAAAAFDAAGGHLLSPPSDIPVGRVAVVADPFGNALVLVDLSKGRYRTADDGTVTGIVDEEP
jgi:predicted enzyme related to lactoylglutathione lyase